MTRVLFVNRYFHPDFSATSQMLSDLALDLSAEGFDVTVVTSRQRYDSPGASLPAFEVVGGVKVHRIATSAFGRTHPAGRLVDYLTFHVSALIALLRLVDRESIVVAKTDPPLIGITAGWVAALKRARLVNWLQDLFPEVLGALTTRPAARLGIAPLAALRDRYLRRAACNVAVGHRMATLLAERMIPVARIAVIENWADGTVVRPVSPEANALRKEWGLQDAFVVGYSGNLGMAHEVETIMQAARLLRERTNVVFLFIGGGTRVAEVQRVLQQEHLTNIVFRPYQPRERLADSLSVPDLHLVCLRPAMEGLVVPSKLYGILAAGRPCVFIGAPTGECAASLRQAQCGYTVAGGDGEGLAHIVRQLADDRPLTRELGVRAGAAFRERFDRPLGVRRWSRLLGGLATAATDTVP